MSPDTRRRSWVSSAWRILLAPVLGLHLRPRTAHHQRPFRQRPQRRRRLRALRRGQPQTPVRQFARLRIAQLNQRPRQPRRFGLQMPVLQAILMFQFFQSWKSHEPAHARQPEEHWSCSAALPEAGITYTSTSGLNADRHTSRSSSPMCLVPTGWHFPCVIPAPGRSRPLQLLAGAFVHREICQQVPLRRGKSALDWRNTATLLPCLLSSQADKSGPSELAIQASCFS